MGAENSSIDYSMKVTHLDSNLVEQFHPDFDPASRLEEQGRALERMLEMVANAPDDQLLRADLGRAWTRLGESRRLNRDYETAIDANLAAAGIWSEMGRRKAEFLANIRLDFVRLRAGEGDLSVLTSRLKEIDADPTLEFYRDMVHDFASRLQFSWGDFDGAWDSMSKALQVRQDAGRDIRQIAETIKCLKTIKSAARNH